VQNLAISRAERIATNPWAAMSQNLKEAREDFIAICHGKDSRGQTQIGRSLYPWVPDLLSPSTQSLSDGEIHYIIENGVRLNGMPRLEQSAPGDGRRELETPSIDPPFAATEGERRVPAE
jgi:hypothetical protein